MNSTWLKCDVIVHQEKETVVPFNDFQHLIYNRAKTRPRSDGAYDCRWQDLLDSGSDGGGPLSVRDKEQSLQRWVVLGSN